MIQYAAKRRYEIYQDVPIKPLTGILIRIIQSEPPRAELCHFLEEIVLEAISTSPRRMSTQDLISSHLCRGSFECIQRESKVRT